MAERPLRVLYVHHTAMLGGAGASLLCLLRHLPPGDVEPTLACPPGGHVSEEGSAGRAHIHETPSWDPEWSLHPGSILRQRSEMRDIASRLAQLCESHRPDIIHANTWPSAVAAVRGCSGVAPIVWHVRDVRLRRPVVSRLAGGCAAAIAISQTVAERLVALGWAGEQMHLVYNGVDPVELRPSRPKDVVRAELGVDPGSPVIGTVGRLAGWKRHDLLVRAARLIIDEMPAAQFVFVGGEPTQERGRMERLRRLATDLGVADSVRFLGQRRDVADLVGAMDVFLHAAEDEPLGRAVMEAMTLGRPVVAPAAGGPAELIEDGVSGLLVSPGSAEALAHGVLRMLRDPDLAAACGGNAQRRMEAEFCAERMAAETVAIYRGLVGRGQ